MGIPTSPSSATARRDAQRLEHVRWIGGGSGAGKSTIARRIAAERGMRVYATDDAMADHARRSTRADAPLLHAFMAMDPDERWVHRSPDAMLETFPWFRGEGFGLVVDDVLRLPREPGIVVEGFRLLPSLVAPLLADARHAVWLLPTPAFREAAFAGRGGASWSVVARTGDPQRALRNLLERDRRFTELLRDETARLGLRTLEVEDGVGEDALVGRVLASLGFEDSHPRPATRPPHPPS